MTDHANMLRQAAAEMRHYGHDGWPNVCDWGADELDRLNAQALELCAGLSGLRRENERLRSDAEAMRHDLAVLRGFHHEGCMAEIERLRGALQRIADQYSDKYCGYPEKEADQMARNDLAEIASEALAGATDQPDDATERTGIEFLHLWMRTPNPMLGNISPLDMMDSGRGERLADFIRQAAEADGITDPTDGAT